MTGTGPASNNCESDINECLADPCQNNAVCAESSTDPSIGVSEFQCTCANGFAGDLCESAVDLCATDPCVNGGVCVDMRGQYDC